ncbi:hypothetical protein BDB00DRAFT_837128 [Zychaea mexicana]|uniref:uncharacterized protein n=1 Tax=Zychaea mexicana TaxID=64656 RepID=UPI0022FE40C3|nr:uncharacterized protein BDB00DRAFT_837128 [Zychaea mexicana]KAI9490577.1 hypothetical protein BDB00DRAFT_837128 [Zychaea mexicana]
MFGVRQQNKEQRDRGEKGNRKKVKEVRSWLITKHQRESTVIVLLSVDRQILHFGNILNNGVIHVYDQVFFFGNLANHLSDLIRVNVHFGTELVFEIVHRELVKIHGAMESILLRVGELCKDAEFYNMQNVYESTVVCNTEEGYTTLTRHSASSLRDIGWIIIEGNRRWWHARMMMHEVRVGRARRHGWCAYSCHGRCCHTWVRRRRCH